MMPMKQEYIMPMQQGYIISTPLLLPSQWGISSIIYFANLPKLNTTTYIIAHAIRLDLEPKVVVNTNLLNSKN